MEESRLDLLFHSSTSRHSLPPCTLRNSYKNSLKLLKSSDDPLHDLPRQVQFDSFITHFAPIFSPTKSPRTAREQLQRLLTRYVARAEAYRRIKLLLNLSSKVSLRHSKLALLTAQTGLPYTLRQQARNQSSIRRTEPAVEAPKSPIFSKNVPTADKRRSSAVQWIKSPIL